MQIFVKPRTEDTSDEEDSTVPKKSAQDQTTADEVLQSEDSKKDGLQQSADLKTPSGHKREV